MGQFYNSPEAQIEATVAKHVFAWVSEEGRGEAKKFDVAFTPQSFLTVDDFKLASTLVEKMNLRYSELHRFPNCEAKFDLDISNRDCCWGRNNIARLHLLGASVFTDICTKFIKIPPSDLRYMKFSECYTLHLKVNGVDVKHNDDVRTSEAARCILATIENNPIVRHARQVK